MGTDTNKADLKLIRHAIREVLNSGSVAALSTLMDLPEMVTKEIRIGAKLLIDESGETVGSLGDSELDDAVVRQALAFLTTRDEAKTGHVNEFAPELEKFQSTQILFERIEAEPRLIVAGAGHVGASLARLAALVGYRVTLIDDRDEFVSRESFAADSEQHIGLIAADDWATGAECRSPSSLAGISRMKTVSVRRLPRLLITSA